MPLIVFVGISSMGALFLILFFAELWRDERQRQHARPWSGAPSTIPLATTPVSNRKSRSNVKVLRPPILCGGPNRLTYRPIERMQGEARKVWQ